MKNITVLNFDQVYEGQTFWQGESCEWLDFEQIPRTNLFCETSTLMKLARRLKMRKSSAITFIGSGNYHYMTYLLLREIDHPFTLVLIDHHTDTLQIPNNSMITCGSWVLEAIKRHPFLKQVIIIGVSEDGLQYIPSSISDKITTFTKEALYTDFTKTITAIFNSIRTNSIYISIDKDVLSEEEAATAWDHGSLKLKEMLEIIKHMGKHKKITGMDVCGEYPINPTNAYTRKTRTAIRKNDHANRQLLDVMKRYILPAAV